MNTHVKLGMFAAFTLSTVVLAPLPAFAGNDHSWQQQLEWSRAHALRARCMDARGRCIESMMVSDNSQYRCPTRQFKETDVGSPHPGLLSVMFCE